MTKSLEIYSKFICFYETLIDMQFHSNYVINIDGLSLLPNVGMKDIHPHR